MLKCAFIVVMVLAPLRTGVSQYVGDSCYAEDRPGSCQMLSQCVPLMNEIRRAGQPMPSYIRKKLQSLHCGFQINEPLVCCVAFTNTEPVTPSTTEWTLPDGSNQGTGPFINLIPNNTIPDTPDTWNPPDTGTRDSQPGVSSNSDKPPDVRNHRNLNLLPANCGLVDEDRIWGGTQARLFEMPWMVLVQYDSPRGPKLSCGGTLITDRYVLTAAHCVVNLGERLTLSGIILGEYDVRQDPDCERQEGKLNCAPNIVNSSIEKVIPHAGYQPPKLTDDIALVKLANPANFSLESMSPICLPTTAELQDETLVGTNGIVAGWGATEDGLQSPVLLSVSLPVVSNSVCQTAYKGNPKINSRQLCAGGMPDKDSCGGDSGGPLIFPGRLASGAVRHIQRGIVSYGAKRCGLGGLPGVYTRVGHYMDWILDNIGN